MLRSSACTEALSIKSRFHQVSRTDIVGLSLEEIRLMQLYATQQQAAKEYAKARRIGGKP